MSIPSYDLPTLYANLDQYLTKAQHDLELAIEAYGHAGDEHATRHAEYRKAKAEAIKRLKEAKHPATLIGDLAQGEVAELKEAEMASEYKAKRCKFAIDAIQERINMMKYIGRSSERVGA